MHCTVLHGIITAFRCPDGDTPLVASDIEKGARVKQEKGARHHGRYLQLRQTCLFCVEYIVTSLALMVTMVTIHWLSLKIVTLKPTSKAVKTI